MLIYFADPDLYDRLVRRFQTPAEREAEGRARGWGKTLESSLMRGEARLERVASSYTGDRVPPSVSNGSSRQPSRDNAVANFAIDSDLVEDKPTTKEEGRAAWEEYLRERFVKGADEDFDYSKVDGNDGLDSLEDRDREEAYFDEEEPEWADDSDGEDDDEEATDDVKELGQQPRPRRERVLLGETGIQDY